MQISDEDATELFNICKSITIPLQQYKKYEHTTECRGGRAKQFGNHRASLLGYTLARFKPRSIGPQLSYFSKKHPRLYECLVNISKKYFPEHNWKTIQLNHNVVCTPHIDKYNNGKSIIFSVGDYIGCNLCIETTEGIEEIDIRNKITSFEGARYKHWNTPLISGDKYSFVFYA